METCRNKQKKHWVVTTVAVFLVSLAILPVKVLSYELLLGTGETSSFSYFAGKAVCRAVNKADNGLSCKPVPSVNFTDSLTNVQSGSLDLALVNSKIIYDAFHGAGLFQYVSLDYSQLRLVVPLYRMPVSLVVTGNSEIESVDDLEGRKVNSGAPSSLEEIIFEEILNAKGWQEDSFSLLQRLSSVNSQDFIALHNNSIQALIHVGMHPDRRLENSIINGHTGIVGISGTVARSIIDNNSGYYDQSIPAQTYNGQQEAIDTLSLETLLITSTDMDGETVERVLSAVISAKKQLQNAHPAFLEHKVSTEILNRSYLHPHPEALLFFQVNQNRL